MTKHPFAALDYATRLERNDAFEAPLHRSIVDWLAVRPGTTALDAGCGVGGMTALLATAVGPGGGVVASDVAAAHLSAARRRLATGTIDYHHGPIEAYDWQGQFDLVWCAHVIHGLADQLGGVRALVAATVPGGRVVVREDHVGLRCLLDDLNDEAPGLEHRLHDAEQRAFAAWRRSLPGSIPYRFGWARMLRDSGCAEVTTRSFLLELLAPMSSAQTAVLLESLTGALTNPDITSRVTARDRRALGRLTDPAAAEYLLGRDDLHIVHVATVYIGRLPGG